MEYFGVKHSLRQERFFWKKRFLNFGDHNFGGEVFILPLFRNVFPWGPFRACFGFVTMRATLAHVKQTEPPI